MLLILQWKVLRLIKELTEQEVAKTGANIRFEYSPESFSGTEMDNAVLICDKVLETLGATPEHKVILNLPNTVEGYDAESACGPN